MGSLRTRSPLKASEARVEAPQGDEAWQGRAEPGQLYRSDQRLREGPAMEASLRTHERYEAEQGRAEHEHF